MTRSGVVWAICTVEMVVLEMWSSGDIRTRTFLGIRCMVHVIFLFVRRGGVDVGQSQHWVIGVVLEWLRGWWVASRTYLRPK